MSKFTIGYEDIDPDTGNAYPFVKICECEHEWAATWIISVLTRDLSEHSDEPNRQIKLRKNENT
jgi:hypothetical protein